MMVYAQINEQGFCVGVSQLAGEVNQENLIELESFDMSYIKRKYDIQNKMWTDQYYIPEQLDQSQPTDAEFMQQQLTDIELQNLEAQYERQLIAQQISDLELSVMGGGTNA